MKVRSRAKATNADRVQALLQTIYFIITHYLDMI